MRRLNCQLCGKQEIAFNLNTRKYQAVNHPEGATGIICSSCLQMILSSGQDKLKKAYHKALSAEELAKAKALKGFIGGDPDEITRFESPDADIVQEQTTSNKENNGETTEPKRDMGGKGVMRKARASYHQLRPERTTRQLDKRRVAVR